VSYVQPSVRGTLVSREVGGRCERQCEQPPIRFRFGRNALVASLDADRFAAAAWGHAGGNTATHGERSFSLRREVEEVGEASNAGFGREWCDGSFHQELMELVLAEMHAWVPAARRAGLSTTPHVQTRLTFLSLLMNNWSKVRHRPPARSCAHTYRVSYPRVVCVSYALVGCEWLSAGAPQRVLISFLNHITVEMRMCACHGLEQGCFRETTAHPLGFSGCRQYTRRGCCVY
jgi:hypothetical protein